jgi:hypothetical protein
MLNGFLVERNAIQPNLAAKVRKDSGRKKENGLLGLFHLNLMAAS